MRGLPQSTDLLLHDYAYLRDWGLSTAECAKRLGKSTEVMRLILKRAALRSDTRSDWSPQVRECSGTHQSLQNHRERSARSGVKP